MERRVEAAIYDWVWNVTAEVVGPRFYDRPLTVRRRRPRYPLLVTAGDDPGLELLALVLVEALEERLDEPGAQGLEPLIRRDLNPFSVVEVLDKSTVGSAVRQLVEETYQSGNGGVRAIDVLEAIHLRWCNIWPFCRPTPAG